MGFVALAIILMLRFFHCLIVTCKRQRRHNGRGQVCPWPADVKVPALDQYPSRQT
jgi:hypothetical protein